MTIGIGWGHEDTTDPLFMHKKKKKNELFGFFPSLLAFYNIETSYIVVTVDDFMPIAVKIKKSNLLIKR